MLVVGEKETADGTVSVRTRKGGDNGVMKTEEFIEMIVEEIRSKQR